jgi:hypothetical protein
VRVIRLAERFAAMTWQIYYMLCCALVWVSMKPGRLTRVIYCIVGTIVALMVIGTVAVWWKTHVERSAEDDAIYDACLIRSGGNTILCDALMRTRKRAAEKAR